MTNCSKFGTYGNLPIIKAHPQAGKTSFIGVLNIGTFGHAISLENEIEKGENPEQSSYTNPVSRLDIEQQILCQYCRICGM